MRIATARYRLLFKRPFTTAHGTRDGTDSVFVRIEHQGMVGFGEATLPPYLKLNADAVEADLRKLGPIVHGHDGHPGHLLTAIDEHLSDNPPAQNAASMAVLDLIGRLERVPLWRLLGMDPPPGASKAMVTIATKDLNEVEARLKELPASDVLKVKLGTPDDLELIKLIKQLDRRPLLLDGNQGIATVDQALRSLDLSGDDVVGIEQPFHAADPESHGELKRRTSAMVIADESLQGLDDLQVVANAFSAVNIKLMKCGGLRNAAGLITEARRAGLGVMLGSMSESSLGCLAMYHLAAGADLVDLDGPWLIGNDPFGGMELLTRPQWTPEAPGVGAALRRTLDFDPLGV